MKKLKRSSSTDWKLQNSHGDVKYSIGNIVNNIVITTYGAKCILEISRGHFVKSMIV